jgi:outer membrane protein assembly factor BamE (lipoprotein component of BamABCDE complex)
MATKHITIALATVALIGLSACSATSNVRGNMVPDHILATVQPGVDNAGDVMRKLGSPTARDPFDPSVWYYIGQRTEKRGILDPKVVEERVLIAKFSPEGTLASLTEREGGRNDIPYSREKTPTSGNEITFMQQLLGNLGKFNKDELGSKK